MTAWILRLVSRVRGLFGQKQAETEFDLETQTHLQLLTEKYIQQGMDPKDAESAARCQFGNTTLLQQRHRESRTLLFFPNLLLDLRYGLRMFWKSPAFTVIEALTLALGIGATSAVFSLIHGVLLTPPPYQKPQQVMLIQSARTDEQKMETQRAWPAQQWMEWNEKLESFQGMAGYGWTFNFLIRNDGSQSLQGMQVSKDYFRLLGLKTVAWTRLRRFGLRAGACEVDSARIRVLETCLWRRSRHYRQDGPHQPLGFFTSGRRHYGTGCTIPALAWRSEGAELRCQCNGGFVGAGQS